MSRKYNFYAGPSILPVKVLEQIQSEMTDFNGFGLSLIEMSHRGAEYDRVHNETVALVREILGLPEDFHVLFLGGGATMQFSMVPLNLMGADESCDFTLTGAWSKKAYADAGKIGNVNVVFDGVDGGYRSLPETVNVSPDARYLHVTSNETIDGVQWKQFPETGNVPLVADMSSDIMSRRVPIEKFDLIYAGAQKNLGPAGVTLVIIRDALLQKCRDDLTAYLSYKVHAPKNSLYNTPPVFPIYAMGLVLKQLRDRGGLETIEAVNRKKAALLYDLIDGSNGFYRASIEPAYRSDMNIVFKLDDAEMEKPFLSGAEERGIVGIKGHRSVGGCRASLYNAMPLSGVEYLAKYMEEFQETHR